MTNIQLIVTYLREDGKYLGGVYSEEVEKGTRTKFTVPDNGGLEHILYATIDSVKKTKEGEYSFLLKLDPPASQRVIDLQWFRKMKDCDVGNIEYEKIKVYTNVVLIVGTRFEKGFNERNSGRKVDIQGTVVSEETKLIPGVKYAFTIKLDNKLSDEDYKFLKSIEAYEC